MVQITVGTGTTNIVDGRLMERYHLGAIDLADMYSDLWNAYSQGVGTPCMEIKGLLIFLYGTMA